MIARLISVAKNKTLQNIGLVTVGNVLNAGIGFVTLILVSRTLGPAQFGVFSVITGFFTFFTKGGDLGTNSTLIKYLPLFREKKDTKSEKEFVGFILGLTYLLTLVSFMLFVPFYKNIASLLNVSEYSTFILISILASFFVVMFNTYNVVLQSLEKFSYFLTSYSVATVVKFLVILSLLQIARLNMDNSLLIYLLLPIVGYLLSGYFSKISLPYKIKPNLNKQSFIKATPFLYFMGLASVLGALHEQSGIFMSSIVFSDFDTGLFAAASKISIVFGLIAGSVGTVVIPRAARYQDGENIKIFSKKTIYLGLFLSLSVLPVILFPKIFIKLTSGVEYLEAAPYLVVLSIVGGFTVFRSTFSSLFYALNKASYFAFLGVINVFFEIPLLYFMAKGFGVIGLAYGKLITGIILTVFSVFYYLSSLKNAK